MFFFLRIYILHIIEIVRTHIYNHVYIYIFIVIIVIVIIVINMIINVVIIVIIIVIIILIIIVTIIVIIILLLLLYRCICAMVKTWYMVCGHPFHIANPYSGYINPYENRGMTMNHPLSWENTPCFDHGRIRYICLKFSGFI